MKTIQGIQNLLQIMAKLINLIRKQTVLNINANRQHSFQMPASKAQK